MIRNFVGSIIVRGYYKSSLKIQKVIIRRRDPKDRQYNSQKKKDKKTNSIEQHKLPQKQSWAEVFWKVNQFLLH